MKAKNAASALGIFCAGAGIGVVAGLLYAPRSGKHTRKQLRRFADRKMDRVEGFRDEMMSRATDGLDRVKNTVNANCDAVAQYMLKEEIGRHGVNL